MTPYEIVDSLDCLADELDELGCGGYYEDLVAAMSLICETFSIEKKQFGALDSK